MDGESKRPSTIFAVSSAALRVDWADEDTAALDCRGPSGACANDKFVAGDFHFWKLKRTMPTAVYVGVALGFMAGLLVWNAASEFSLGPE
jgi:hypothetical protein